MKITTAIRIAQMIIGAVTLPLGPVLDLNENRAHHPNLAIGPDDVTIFLTVRLHS